MSQLHESQDANRRQIEFWNGGPGRRWVTNQETLDRVWRPIGDPAIERAAVLPGERVIDVGCGCGATTLELAARIGPLGISSRHRHLGTYARAGARTSADTRTG